MPNEYNKIWERPNRHCQNSDNGKVSLNTRFLSLKTRFTILKLRKREQIIGWLTGCGYTYNASKGVYIKKHGRLTSTVFVDDDLYMSHTWVDPDGQLISELETQDFTELNRHINDVPREYKVQTHQSVYLSNTELRTFDPVEYVNRCLGFADVKLIAVVN